MMPGSLVQKINDSLHSMAFVYGLSMIVQDMDKCLGYKSQVREAVQHVENTWRANSAST